MPIFVMVDDLIFLSRIQQTAKLLNAAIEVVTPARLIERLAQDAPPALICDLNHSTGQAVEIIRELKRRPEFSRVPVIGFLSHVQADLAAAARQAGCDVVMARSAFSQQLPKILQECSGDAPALSTGRDDA